MSSYARPFVVRCMGVGPVGLVWVGLGHGSTIHLAVGSGQLFGGLGLMWGDEMEPWITPLQHRHATKCVDITAGDGRPGNVVYLVDVSSGGRQGSSATSFCLFITDRRPHSTIQRGPSLSDCRCSYLEQSLLHLRCLSSSHASRLISSPFPVPVPDHVQRSRSDIVILDSFTYLLGSKP